MWIVWFGLSLAAFLYFVRGMRALTEIPRRLERIEQLLASDHESRREDGRAHESAARYSGEGRGRSVGDSSLHALQVAQGCA